MWDGTARAAPGTSPAVAATAVAAGVGYATTQITVKLGAIVSPAVTLSIGPPVLQSIAITPAALPPIPLGGSITFSAQGNFSDGSTSAVAGAGWVSSNTSVVSINAAGVAIATGAGLAVLTATSGLIARHAGRHRDHGSPHLDHHYPGDAGAGRRGNACRRTAAGRPQSATGGDGHLQRRDHARSDQCGDMDYQQRRHRRR